MEARKDCPRWILHDGPPFANGDIHIGHLINKMLKDVVIRFRSMQGQQTPYVPGWDCHGLPIEHKIQEELGPKWRRDAAWPRSASAASTTRRSTPRSSPSSSSAWASSGEWDEPYLTMTPEYEAATLEVFAKFVEAGLVYKKLKPVPWSIANQTALADAELEYKDVEDPQQSIVEFPAADAAQVLGERRGAASARSATPPNPDRVFLVWTTTPWTLPANLAIAVHPEVRYALVRYTRDGQTSPRRRRRGPGRSRLQAQRRRVLSRFSARPRARTSSRRSSNTAIRSSTAPARVLPALYVTTTDGTGLVHTAPGHGEEDYDTGLTNGLPVYCPVLANGRFDDTVPEWLRGQTVWEANPLITEQLREAERPLRRGEDHPQLPARLAEQDARHLPRDRAVVHRRR